MTECTRFVFQREHGGPSGTYPHYLFRRHFPLSVEAEGALGCQWVGDWGGGHYRRAGLPEASEFGILWNLRQYFEFYSSSGAPCHSLQHTDTQRDRHTHRETPRHYHEDRGSSGAPCHLLQFRVGQGMVAGGRAACRVQNQRKKSSEVMGEGAERERRRRRKREVY